MRGDEGYVLTNLGSNLLTVLKEISLNVSIKVPFAMASNYFDFFTWLDLNSILKKIIIDFDQELKRILKEEAILIATDNKLSVLGVLSFANDLIYNYPKLKCFLIKEIETVKEITEQFKEAYHKEIDNKSSRFMLLATQELKRISENLEDAMYSQSEEAVKRSKVSFKQFRMKVKEDNVEEVKVNLLRYLRSLSMSLLFFKKSKKKLIEIALEEFDLMMNELGEKQQSLVLQILFDKYGSFKKSVNKYLRQYARRYIIPDVEAEEEFICLLIDLILNDYMKTITLNINSEVLGANSRLFRSLKYFYLQDQNQHLEDFLLKFNNTIDNILVKPHASWPSEQFIKKNIALATQKLLVHLDLSLSNSINQAIGFHEVMLQVYTAIDVALAQEEEQGKSNCSMKVIIEEQFKKWIERIDKSMKQPHKSQADFEKEKVSLKQLSATTSGQRKGY
jgi:hypothetical protein